jgi:hypothetical protein
MYLHSPICHHGVVLLVQSQLHFVFAFHCPDLNPGLSEYELLHRVEWKDEGDVSKNFCRYFTSIYL